MFQTRKDRSCEIIPFILKLTISWIGIVCEVSGCKMRDITQQFTQSCKISTWDHFTRYYQLIFWWLTIGDFALCLKLPVGPWGLGPKEETKYGSQVNPTIQFLIYNPVDYSSSILTLNVVKDSAATGLSTERSMLQTSV